VVHIPNDTETPEATTFTNIGDKAVELEKLITSIEDSAPGLRQMGADISSLKALAEAGKEALISGDLEKIAKIVKRGTEELENAQSEAVNSGLERINSYMDAAKRLEVDMGGMTPLFNKINDSMKSSDYGRTLEGIVSYIGSTEKMLTDKVASAINDARTQARSAETLTDLSSARELIRTAVSLAQNREFEKAYISAIEAKAAVKKALENEARTIFEYAMGNVRPLKSMGADFSAMDSLFTEASSAIQQEDWRDLMGISDKILEELEKLMPKIADELFLSAKISVVDVKKIGMETQGLLDMLRQAKAAIEAKDSKTAVRYSSDVRKECDRRLAVYRGATDVLSSASALITEAKRKDIDVTKIIQTLLAAKRSFESRDYKNATELGTACKKELNSLINAEVKKSQPVQPQEPSATQPAPSVVIISEKNVKLPIPEKHAAPDNIETLENMLNETQAIYRRITVMGSKPQGVEEMLAKAESALGSGNASEASGIIYRCQEALKPEILELLGKVSADVDSIMNIISKNDAEVAEIRNSIEKVRKEMDGGKVSRSMSLLNACMDDTEKMVHKRVIERLRQLDTLMKDATRLEGEIIGMTSQMMATSTFHKFDYKSILDFLQSKKKKEEIDQGALMRHIVSIRKNIEEAKKLGVDIKEFKDTLKNVIDTVRRGNIEAAFNSAVSVEKKLSDVLVRAKGTAPGAGSN
jgi:hypothetical protein